MRHDVRVRQAQTFDDDVGPDEELLPERSLPSVTRSEGAAFNRPLGRGTLSRARNDEREDPHRSKHLRTSVHVKGMTEEHVRYSP